MMIRELQSKKKKEKNVVERGESPENWNGEDGTRIWGRSEEEDEMGFAQNRNKSGKKKCTFNIPTLVSWKVFPLMGC